MNRDEFKKLLDEQEARLDKRMDDKLAKFFAQLSDYFATSTQIQEMRAEFSERFDRLETMMDAVTERVATDEEERAAIVSEQHRHRGWIDQLAEGTGTKLTPPLAEQ